MCGIAGLIQKKDVSKDKSERFINSADLMNHRGPDHKGVFIEDNVTLVHFRLSILDLDARANQPFFTEDKRFCTVYNGELYNYLEIKDDYDIKMQTTSDTEVLLNSYCKGGVEAVKKWNGIFASAIYDREEKEIVLLRDRFGVKPLYFYEDDEVIAFASEAKVILDWLPAFKLNYEGLGQYMWYGNTTTEQTLIEGLKKVKPASILKINTTGPENKVKERFWEISGTKKNHAFKSEADLIGTIKNSLETAVQKQLVADVPLGILLSGGIDSSAIVAMASKHSETKLDTYSVEYDHNIGGESELGKAQMISKKYNTNHHELKIEAKNIVGTFKDLVFQYDEPFADAANIPLYELSKACSTDKKVILQGDGGDEFFGGYRRYNVMDWIWFWKTVSKLSYNFIPQKRMAERMKRLSFVLNQKDSGSRMAYYLTEDVPYKDPYEILNKEVKAQLNKTDPFLAYKNSNKKHETEDKVQRLLYADVEILLPHKYLEKVDKATMLNSVEARVPFLDNNLTELMLGLPSGSKIKNGQKKHLLKKALDGEIPNEILYGKKRGFDVPYKDWLRGDLYDYAFETFKNQNGNIFDKNRLIELLKIHKEKKVDYGSLLWKALVLSEWLNIYEGKIRF
jgi:asparagine synthase (glutamine-hydrolysing)